MPRISHQLEYSLYVDDLQRSAAFYRRVLGFEEYLADDRMIGLGVPGNSVLLLFVRGGSVEPSPTPTGTIPPHDATGHQHLAFAIPVGELAAWEAHLAAEGVALESRDHLAARRRQPLFPRPGPAFRRGRHAGALAELLSRLLKFVA